MSNRTVLHGIGVSAGTASGPVAVVTPAVGLDEHEPASTDPEADGERILSLIHISEPTRRS